MKKVRDPKDALEGLVPYDAKAIKADVVLSNNEHPDNIPKEIIS